VNVGKAKRVPMADWRDQLHALGYTEVATVLNSGNAVFCAAEEAPEVLALAIAGALETGLGVSARVVVKTAAEFDAVVDGYPFGAEAADPSRVLVAFTRDPEARAWLDSLSALAVPPESFVVADQAAYLSCPMGLLESKVGSALVGKGGESVTTRNWATVLRVKGILAERTCR
jgi:uncharacterized protein (DUF1697 family)